MFTIIIIVLVLVYESFCNTVCIYGHANKASCCCCNADFTQEHDSPSSFTRIFILKENIHATRVVTLSAAELDTISKYNLMGITLGRNPIRGIKSLTLHPLMSIINL